MEAYLLLVSRERYEVLIHLMTQSVRYTSCLVFKKNETDTIRDSLEGQIYSFPAASCAPPHSLATTGSLPQMAQLCMCTVT